MRPPTGLDVRPSRQPAATTVDRAGAVIEAGMVEAAGIAHAAVDGGVKACGPGLPGPQPGGPMSPRPVAAPIRHARHAGGSSRKILRPATPEDIAELMRIEAEVFDYERLTRRSFARYIGLASAVVLVLELAGDLVGYGLVTFRAAAGTCRLESIAVATRATGRGLGVTLMREIQSIARERGAKRLQLEVRRDNRAALALYDRLGFRLQGLRAAYYCDGCDALRMDIDL